MATKWTAERDQHLLLLIINNTKIDFPDIARKWAEKFADEDFKPTPKAIHEHVAKLKRDMKDTAGSRRGSTLSTPTASNKTPNSARASTFKTPTSGRKRKVTAMSEEDDEDDESRIDFSTPMPKRQATSRRSKSITRSYLYVESSADEGEKEGESDDGLDAAYAAVMAKAGATVKPSVRKADRAHGADREDSIFGIETGFATKAASRILADDSEFSDFAPVG